MGLREWASTSALLTLLSCAVDKAESAVGPDPTPKTAEAKPVLDFRACLKEHYYKVTEAESIPSLVKVRRERANRTTINTEDWAIPSAEGAYKASRLNPAYPLVSLINLGDKDSDPREVAHAGLSWHLNGQGVKRTILGTEPIEKGFVREFFDHVGHTVTANLKTSHLASHQSTWQKACPDEAAEAFYSSRYLMEIAFGSGGLALCLPQASACGMVGE